MTTSNYRKEYEAQLQGLQAMRAQGGSEAASADASDKPDEAIVKKLIEVLSDSNAKVDDRTAALYRLKEIEFVSPLVDAHRADYIEALRNAAQSKNSELAAGALEVLAAKKDPAARDALLGFLKAPGSAPFPLARAVQLLSYDDHAAVAPAVRPLLETSDDPVLKGAALRVLASDPASEGTFAKILADKAQPREIRALSASGLHNVNPTSFAKVARKIVEDDNEDENLRASCLSTLTHFSDYAANRKDQTFAKSVERLQTTASSVHLKATADRFMERVKQMKQEVNQEREE